MSAVASASYSPDVSDIDLMTRARYGDRAAFTQIVRLYQHRLYNALLRLVGDAGEAGELTQETFTRALAKIDEFPADQPPYAWLFRQALNLAVTAMRRTHTRTRRDFSAAEDPAHKPLLEAIGKLEMDYRAALVMRDIERFDYQQMADVLALPLAGVKSRLFRARLALRDELGVAPSA